MPTPDTRPSLLDRAGNIRLRTVALIGGLAVVVLALLVSLAFLRPDNRDVATAAGSASPAASSAPVDTETVAPQDAKTGVAPPDGPAPTCRRSASTPRRCSTRSGPTRSRWPTPTRLGWSRSATGPSPAGRPTSPPPTPPSARTSGTRSPGGRTRTTPMRRAASPSTPSGSRHATTAPSRPTPTTTATDTPDRAPSVRPGRRAVKETVGPGYGLAVQITAPAQRTPTR